MKSRKASIVQSALEKKGMTAQHKHHVMLRKKVDGVTMLVTRISHGVAEINDTIASQMAKQCGLKLAEFHQLVDCTMSGEEWDRLVKERCPDGRNPYLTH